MKLFFGEIFPEVKINEDEQQHIVKVLRMREGDEIYLTDGKGNLAKGTLQFLGKKVELEVSDLKKNLPNFNTHLHIAIAPTKNIDRTEFFLEKATEMGASEITFLLTENSERKHIKFERLEKQAIAASKQSLRVHFPKLNDLTKLTDCIEQLDAETTFVAHCNDQLERMALSDVTSAIKDNGSGALTFLIGPEGDFSPREIDMLATKKIRAVSLGNQRLRTETAGVFVAAWHYYQMSKTAEENND